MEEGVGMEKDDGNSHQRNARKIVESADLMGLEIIGGKDKAIQDIDKQVDQSSDGVSGGLLTTWDKSLFKLVGAEKNQNWVWTTFQTEVTGHFIHIVNVYAPQNSTDKRELSHMLKSKKVDTRDFNSFIGDMNLSEVPMVRGNFTWIGPSNKRSKLDRVLVNFRWMGQIDWIVEASPRRNYDHKVLVLKQSNNDWGPKPFKFFNVWLKDESLNKAL
ncbi:hypothetical protein POM88_021431 [Heracleum sosnowskyi]|uniref:Uncharacterized protein n=1 Tax=Heracleum sosnowskyi TaxID=360622 RepID=A0AAD8IEU8_9APIA|nr:hypothetical protein POM88_021431 [Heracleum sosnowskyi]